MIPPAALYLDTSAVLRAVLEAGTTPEIEEQIASAPILLTSSVNVLARERITGLELLTADERLRDAAER